MRRAALLAIVGLCSWVSPATASTFTLDLAAQAAGTSVTLPAPVSGDVTFRVINRRPDQDYTFSIVDKIEEIAAFASPGVNKFAGSPTDCQSIVAIAKSLDKDTKESDIGSHVAQIQQALGAGACSDPNSLRDIQEFVARTTFDIPGSYSVPPGHDMTLTVARTEAGKALNWTLIVQGGSRGTWLTTYGATVVPDHNEDFFSQAAAQQGQFNIVRLTNRNPLVPIPSVFYSWIPRSRQDKNWFVGPTVGLGVKSDRPAAFLGLTLTYNWNLGVVAGLALVQEDRLNSKYVETFPPQTVSENLSSDQLNAQTSHVRPFVGVTFRFGSNPFTSTSDATPKTAAGTTTAGAAATDTKKPAK